MSRTLRSEDCSRRRGDARDRPAEPLGGVEPARDDEVASERLRDRVVLDADGGLVTDDAGRVWLAPWRTLDPAFWADSDEPGDDLDSLSADLDRRTE